jgi:hypothetical protein
VACCHSFIFIFKLIKQTCNAYATRRVPSCCPHGFRSVEGLLWGASRDSNSRLPYRKPMRYCLSHAAPTIFTVLRLYSTVVHGRYKVVLKHRFMRKKSFAVTGYVHKLTWWLWLGDVPRLPDCTADGLLPLCVEGGRGGLAASATGLPHHCSWFGCTRLAFQQEFLKFIRSKRQFCGSGSGIRCLFDPWVRDPGWIKIWIRDEPP